MSSQPQAPHWGSRELGLAGTFAASATQERGQGCLGPGLQQHLRVALASLELACLLCQLRGTVGCSRCSLGKDQRPLTVGGRVPA